jgi:glycosyltransferase involved in cell wall biosynthesis
MIRQQMVLFIHGSLREFGSIGRQRDMTPVYATWSRNAVAHQAVMIAGFVLGLPMIVLTLLPAAMVTTFRRRNGKSPRLVWVGVPVNSHADVSCVMRTKGYTSTSVATEAYPTSDRQRYDHWIPLAHRLPRGLNAIVEQARAYALFAHALLTADILHGFFDGGFLRRTALREHEYRIWKLSGKRLILMPYGRDSFVYSDMPQDQLKTIMLKKTYPQSSDEDDAIRRRLARFTGLADVVIGCVGHTVCLPRVDVWAVLWYPGNTALEPHWPRTEGTIKVAHASNHRLVKGTEELIAAVERLRVSGLDIQLDVIERVPNAEAIERFARADIVVDQLYEGYALAAVEAMTLGKVVISALENEATYTPFRQHSYLDRCPIVSADTSTIEQVLRTLVERRAGWPQIGRQTRAYVEAFHSPEASARLFTAIYETIWFDHDTDLNNFWRTSENGRRGA